MSVLEGAIRVRQHSGGVYPRLVLDSYPVSKRRITSSAIVGRPYPAGRGFGELKAGRDNDLPGARGR
jgi:hypothetical protein